VHNGICAGGCNADDGPKDKQDVELFLAEALKDHGKKTASQKRTKVRYVCKSSLPADTTSRIGIRVDKGNAIGGQKKKILSSTETNYFEKNSFSKSSNNRRGSLLLPKIAISGDTTVKFSLNRPRMHHGDIIDSQNGK
jgi:hypothetical protein